MSLVLRSTGSSLIISTSGGSDKGVPVGTPLPSGMMPAGYQCKYLGVSLAVLNMRRETLMGSVLISSHS